MKLTIPPVPPILEGYNRQQWWKWFAFWSLPLERKADLVDEYPELVIVRTMVGAANRVFFNPEVFDTFVPLEVIWKMWDAVHLAENYPFQAKPTSLDKNFLYERLEPMNFAVLAYKYRYTVRPETFFFDVDYNQALLEATTEMELLTFYAPY
jgi:hypothetical protein